MRERAEGVYLPQLSFLHQNDSLPSISTSDVSPEGLASSSSPAMVKSYTNPTERILSSLQQCMLHRPAPTQAAAVQVRAGRDGVSRVGYSFEFGIIGEL